MIVGACKIPGNKAGGADRRLGVRVPAAAGDFPTASQLFSVIGPDGSAARSVVSVPFVEPFRTSDSAAEFLETTDGDRPRRAGTGLSALWLEHQSRVPGSLAPSLQPAGLRGSLPLASVVPADIGPAIPGDPDCCPDFAGNAETDQQGCEDVISNCTVAIRWHPGSGRLYIERGDASS